MRPITAVTIAMILLSSTSTARPHEHCRGTEAHDMLKECLYRHYLTTVRHVADAYKAALVRVETSGQSKAVIRDWTRVLQDTHGRWLAFRDADCNRPIRFEMMQQPELIGIMHLRCRIALTDARLNALKTRYSKPAE